MLSHRLLLYCDICIVYLQYFFYFRHVKLDFFTLHYITLCPSLVAYCGVIIILLLTTYASLTDVHQV